MKQKQQKDDDFMDLLFGQHAEVAEATAVQEHEQPDFADMVQPASAEETTHGDFTVTVNKTGDIVESIDVVCQCGRKTRVLLDYEGERG